MISLKSILIVVIIGLIYNIISELAINVVGPRISGNKSDKPKQERSLQAVQMAESHGYPIEEHDVLTEDGYIITLHRIPRSKDRSNNDDKIKKPVVLIQHGLLAASDTYLFRGPKYDLPYFLADSGYDVWLSNARGNLYSDRHKKFDPETELEFWKFSFHEVGYYDLPAVIDHILNTTKDKSLFFIGHSVGSSVAYILGALRPEYNSKIKLHLSMAPLVYNLHEVSIAHKIALASQDLIRRASVQKNIVHVFPRRQYFAKFLAVFCDNGMPTQFLCLNTLFSLGGGEGQKFNKTMLPELITHFPSGSSIYMVSQAMQWYNERTVFRALDYQNSLENMEKYNSLEPPEYDLSLVNHSVSIHYSEEDFIVTEEDLDYLGNKLPNMVGKFKVPFKDFGHLDFMVGSDAIELVYSELIKLMKKYE